MSEKETNREVDELMHSRIQGEVPEEVEDRLRGRLAEFRVQLGQRRRPNRWRVWATAGAFSLLLAAGLLLMPRPANASRVYASAASQLRTARSIDFTIVMNDEPYVGCEFSEVQPSLKRFACSWGIEGRSDLSSNKQLVLMHYMRTYVIESNKVAGGMTGSAELEQLRALPQQADEVLGERQVGNEKLIGFRLRKAPEGSGIPDLQSFDLWINAATREPHHVDIFIQTKGAPAHQMHIRDIRVNAEADLSKFDMTPPAGYSPITIPAKVLSVHAEFKQSETFSAVVRPMQGSYLQAPVALSAVEEYLKRAGVAPSGPPFGRFASEQNWDAGYPVPPGTRVEPPFQLVTLPSTWVASVVRSTPWGGDSTARWSAFLNSVIEQGYLPDGPPMEIWSGQDGKPDTQSTEMRIQVKR